MAPRVARANIAAAKPKNARQKNKKRALNAYASAQKLVKEKGPNRNRLGEVEDEPRQKRRRDDSDEDGEEEKEELPQRKKRATQDNDDGIEYGSDSEGHEWTMGGLPEGADDSDLDSDEAFGESDEERFAGFTFRGSSSGRGKAKKKKAPARKEVDQDEEDGNDEDSDDSQDDEGLGLGEDAVDLAAMLDDDDEELLGAKDKTAQDLGEESASDEDEDGYSSESESENDEDEDEDDEEDMELRAASMRDRIEALDPSSRKSATPQAVADVTEDDFLEGTSLATENKTKKKSAKPTTLAAPLPKRQQDRLDREVASQKAKEQLDRWRDTVIRNRRAEFLTFPLQDPADQSGTTGKEKFTPATQQTPRNELEESIHRIMEESGLASKPNEQNPDDVGDEETALLRAEELAEKKLPVEEVMRRRAELRKSRELLFREEIKAKRIAKIKSKSYRRVHRKERERQAEREQELLEGLGAEGMDEDEKERQDRKRAQARMNTKHKDSKWAKSLKQTNRTAWDDEARDGAVEQARRNEELKKRIAGGDISDDGSDVSSEDQDDDDDVTMRQLEDLKSNASTGGSRLANLKFMRESDERRRKANNEDVERLRKELAVADGDEAESEAEDEGLGRAIFGPGSTETKKPDPKEGRLEFEAPEGGDDEDGEAEEPQNETFSAKPKVQAKETTGPKSILKKTEKASGPLYIGSKGWLKEAKLEPESTKSTTGWLNAAKAKSKKSIIDEDIVTEVLGPKKTAAAQESKQASKSEPASFDSADKTDGWTVVTYKNNSDSEAEDEPSDPLLSAKDQEKSLQQRAFAGDDVQAAFEAEKDELVVSEDEKEVSNHLPGWGSWTGDGLTKSIRKANARAKHNPLFKTKVDGVRQTDRKDASLKNVIISEKQDRKGKKYLTPVLPHEFETKEQYERSRRLPMGPEWTTKEVHQRMTRPRVVVKKGVNVRALERPIA